VDFIGMPARLHGRPDRHGGKDNVLILVLTNQVIVMAEFLQFTPDMEQFVMISLVAVASSHIS
jgi:hypothetical protein